MRGSAQEPNRAFPQLGGLAERQQISVPTLPRCLSTSTQAILETLKAHKATGTNLDSFGDAELDIHSYRLVA